MFFQRVHHGIAHCLRQRSLGVTRQIVDIHWIGAALTGNDRRIVQKSGNRFTVERGRHHQDFQVFAQRLLAVETKRQRQVGVQMALVEFVKNDEPGIFQFRVGLQTAREDALGEHFDAGFRRHLAVEADAVADGLSRRLAEQVRHASASGARRQPPRFEHQNGTAGDPWLVQQREGNVGGLAGAGWRLQHHGRMRGEGLAQLGQGIVNRQPVHGGESTRNADTR